MGRGADRQRASAFVISITPFASGGAFDAVRNRHDIGVDRMLWSSDCPHITTDWPYSWKTIAATFDGVPADGRHAILAGNAQRLFRFGDR